MKKAIVIFILALALVGAILFYRNTQSTKVAAPSDRSSAIDAPQPEKIIAQKNVSDFQPPLERAKERVTKKPFGIFITPENSPIQSDRFRGYHTGADFEILPEELNSDVFVRAVCSGKVRAREYVNGYGGVAIQDCSLDGNPITVLYGHLRLESINFKVGDALEIGSTIGLLGRDHSQETSGERKHLHLGFHKGSPIDVKGYVQNKNDLADWIDPCPYVCK